MKVGSFLSLIVALFFSTLHGLVAGSATWGLNPTSGDWNTPANWSPATVPNGPSDTASFGSSTVTDLSISAGIEVEGIVFNAGADPFRITELGVVFTISGTGVTNDSGRVQRFVIGKDRSNSSELHFTNGATAGDSVVYTNRNPGPQGLSPLIQFEGNSTAGSAQFYNYAAFFSGHPGMIEFQDNSTAANATFRNTGVGDEQFPTINFRDNASAGQAVFVNEVDAEGEIHFMDSSTADHATITNESAFDSSVLFSDSSTAENATIINEGGTSSNEFGLTYFEDSANAGNGTFIANGGLTTSYGNGQIDLTQRSTAGMATFIANGAEFVGDFAFGGDIDLRDGSTADHATFYANGGKIAGANGGTITLTNSATADNGIFYANGATVDGAFGGRVIFRIQQPTAATATLIATGGVGPGENEGGGILFEDGSTGGAARVELFGSGFLDIRQHHSPRLTIGSLEGDGLVFLGGANLSAGSNNLSTTFSGVLEENSAGMTGALTKIGTGTLELTGANTYTGGTAVEGGKLVVNNLTGSGTGTGVLQVNAGQLGGSGIIAGPVTLGTGSGPGATLGHGKGGVQRDVLTIQSALTFKSDATYNCGLDSASASVDQVVANGVTINGAYFAFLTRGGVTLPVGTVLTVISNTAATPIAGTFTNLPDGSTFGDHRNTFQASYTGGDGNDLTLIVVQ